MYPICSSYLVNHFSFKSCKSSVYPGTPRVTIAPFPYKLFYEIELLNVLIFLSIRSYIFAGTYISSKS